jgi:hypothetical protein
VRRQGQADAAEAGGVAADSLLEACEEWLMWHRLQMPGVAVHSVAGMGSVLGAIEAEHPEPQSALMKKAA